MSSERITRLLLILAIIAVFSMTVSAAETTVSDVRYVSKVYTETPDYLTGSVPQPLEKIENNGIVTSNHIAGKEDQLLSRYILIAKNGEIVTLSFKITTEGIAFDSDLENKMVTLNGIRVTSDTLDTNGDVVVVGTIPNKAPDTPVRIIALKDLPENVKNKINNQFVVYSTTDVVINAKNAIYRLNQMVTADSPQEAKDNLQRAWDYYHAGNYPLAYETAKGGLDISTTTEKTSSAWTGNTIIAIIVFAIIGGIIGVFLDRVWLKRDLIKLEKLVLKYYHMRSENPYAPVKISKECSAALERAFDFNANRADLLKKQKDVAGQRINPDTLKGAGMRPSLFQALYEKRTYHRCAALDGGISYLSACLDRKTGAPVQPRNLRNLFGLIRK